MTRKSSLLDALLPRTKQRVLAAILLHHERSWYLSELARHLHVTPSSLQRELAQFVEAGIVTKRADGNRVYFQADRRCPIFGELAAVLAKTAGLADTVREALADLRPKIDLALIHGSIASGAERSASDVDLMIVGRTNLAELSEVLRRLEADLARTVNVSVYTGHEFQKRIVEGNHFLTSVLKTDLIFVFGTADDLGKLTERATPAGTSHEPSGDQRPPRGGRARPQGRKARRPVR